MSFWQKMKMNLARFMEGRYGVDYLGNFTLYAGLILTILDMFLGSGLLGLMGMALYVITVFRMFSKNREQRMMENRKYIELTGDWKKKFHQFKLRMKNSKQYKYFKCPNCKALLRLTRGCGQKHVTCARCKHEFDQKA